MADEPKKTIEGGLNSLKEKIAAVIDDLASLEVTTYAGEFTLTVSQIIEKENDKFKIKSLMDRAPTELFSKLQLIAYSRFEIDADASNIVKSGMTDEDKILLEAHTEMVKAAQESRKAVFEFAKDLLKIKS